MPKTETVPGTVRNSSYIRHAVLNTIDLHSFGKMRSILIEAQAGQGKSTLARQYTAHAACPCVWFSLTPDDKDAVVMIEKLYTLLKGSSRHFSSRLIATMIAKGEISYQAVGKYARILLSDLKKNLKKELYIVFDDIHLIEDSPASVKFLSSFASDLGLSLHLILISRRCIPREIRAVFQSGQCIYLDTDALAFSRKETREFVHHHMELPLSRKQLNQLYDTTHGWVMGLSSKCFSIKANAKSCMTSEGPHLGNAELDFLYFAEEVYPFMAPSVSVSILKLALLDAIPLGLAREVTGDEAIAEKLAYLCRNNCFLSQQGKQGDTYAFHHLFRDFLRVKCEQKCPALEIHAFLNRAGEWYEEKNDLEKALSCFLKTEGHDKIEALLERHGLEIYRRGRLYGSHQLLQKLPASVVESKCWISFFLGLTAIDIAPSKALHHLTIARALFAACQNEIGELLSAANLCFHHIFIDGQIKTGKTYFYRTTELFQRLRHTLPPFYLARTANALATCNFYYLWDAKASESFVSIAKETARTHDMRSILAEAHTTASFTHMGQGKFFRSAQEIDAQLIHLSDPRVNESAKFLALLSQLNQLEITGDFFNYALLKSSIHRRLHTDTIQHSVLKGFTAIWDTSRCLATGKMDEAMQIITETLAGGEANQSPHLRSQLIHYQAYLYGWFNKPREALTAAADSLALREKAQLPYFETLQAMILGGMYVHLSMRKEAEAYLAKAIEQSEALHERYIRCGALSHRAFMNLRDGHVNEALSDTKQLITYMKLEKYSHFDAWIPQIMGPILAFAHHQGVAPEFVQGLATRRLNVAFHEEGRTLPVLDISTLGPFNLRIGDTLLIQGTQLSQNEQRLLSAIICSPSLSISIHEVCDLLWPDSHGEKAAKALGVMLFRLRKKLANPHISPPFDSQDYLQHKNRQLFLTHCRVDAHTFQKMATEGFTLMQGQHYWQASNAFRRALDLWKGPFLKSFSHDDSAGAFNDRSFLLSLSKVATSWSGIIKTHGTPIQEDMERIENVLSHGAGTPDMMRNLFDIHTASGETQTIRHLTQRYREALVKTGYDASEVELELDGLWAAENRETSLNSADNHQ